MQVFKKAPAPFKRDPQRTRGIVAFMLLAWGNSIALGATAAKPDLLQTLQVLQTKPAHSPSLSRLYARVEDLPNKEVRQAVLRVCSAGLLHQNRASAYRRIVRNRLSAPDAFERQLRDACPDCKGGTRARRACMRCGGTGAGPVSSESFKREVGRAMRIYRAHQIGTWAGRGVRWGLAAALLLALPVALFRKRRAARQSRRPIKPTGEA